MYYTNSSLNDIKNACVSTLAQLRPGKQLGKYFAANNDSSYDYEIWSNQENQNRQFDRIVSFGDSLSDTHNFYNISDWNIPQRDSWALGRFSNGKVWTEHLADNMQIPQYNFAIGTSGVSPSTLGLVKGLGEQVSAFGVAVRNNAQGYRIERTLFTIFTGANDVMTYNTPAAQIVSAHENALTSLLNQGARHIVVMKLPDVTKTPRYVNDHNTSEMRAKVSAVNSGLDDVVSRLNSQWGGQSATITLFDTYSKFNEFLRNPGAYNMTNVTSPCIQYNGDTSFDYLVSRHFCENYDNYLFWDTVHPTSRTHKLLADAVMNELNLR
ncbi:SGNH/GDSL hydrolase family protein [Burkholderia stabilis]|nr:SGNH/GDSL hydrolase family protein [Burkholderia stabilis]